VTGFDWAVAMGHVSRRRPGSSSSAGAAGPRPSPGNAAASD